MKKKWEESLGKERHLKRTRILLSENPGDVYQAYQRLDSKINMRHSDRLAPIKFKRSQCKELAVSVR